MKKCVLKSKFMLHGALMFAMAAPLTTPVSLSAVIPQGQLSTHESQKVDQILKDIKTYTQKIIVTTEALFTKKTSFDADIQELTLLKNEITAIHASIMKHGNAYSQAIFGGLKGLTQHLKQAQTKWVETLKTQNLLKLKANRSTINTEYQGVLRFLLGGLQRDGAHSGEGLIGTFAKAGHYELKAQAEIILANINYIFTYGGDSASSKKQMAVHLNTYKGFKPNIGFLPTGFFNL